MIYYRNDVRASGVDARALKSTATRLLEALGERTSSLSVTFVSDAAMQVLNREHRGKDKTTDVLSFGLVGRAQLKGATPQAALRREPASSGTTSGGLLKPERMLGDVVISVDTARRQAAQYDATLQDELYRLLIHGLLHVLGHDHQEAAERARMEAEERRLADAIGMHWPYEANA